MPANTREKCRSFVQSSAGKVRTLGRQSGPVSPSGDKTNVLTTVERVDGWREGVEGDRTSMTSAYLFLGTLLRA